MPTRLRLTERDVERTVELAGQDVLIVDSKQTVRVLFGGRGFRLRAKLRRTAVALAEAVSPGEQVVGDDDKLIVEGLGAPVAGCAAMSGDTVWVGIEGAVFEFQVSTGPSRRLSADTDALTPPMSATVVRVAVTVGQAVHRGDLLIALEAMKMELPIRAPRDGVVRAVHCREGELVQPGAVLVEWT